MEEVVCKMERNYKTDILSLIEKHFAKDDAEFEKKAWEIAKHFNENGEWQLSAHIHAQIVPESAWRVPDMPSKRSDTKLQTAFVQTDADADIWKCFNCKEEYVMCEYEGKSPNFDFCQGCGARCVAFHVRWYQDCPHCEEWIDEIRNVQMTKMPCPHCKKEIEV
jgi:hypothetical protein